MRTALQQTDAFDSLTARYLNRVSPGRPEASKPLPGRTQIYGAIIQATETGRFALIQGRQTGKWSFPKGHVNRYETPFECVCREVAEEIGKDSLPSPLYAVPLRIGYYYYFNVSQEFELAPRDTLEVMNMGWFTLDEMRSMRLNVDASTYLREQ
jgi:8-oxo-dGTP pyrophosphatase MutT (NUDIX family)